MRKPKLPGGNPEAAHPPFADGKMDLINGLGGTLEPAENAIDLTFWQRQREQQAQENALQTYWKEPRPLTPSERRQRSAEFSAAAANARSKATIEDVETARKLLAMARSFHERARRLAEVHA